MPQPDTAFWTDRLRSTLQAYDESLLRQVSGRLCRPRNHWPAPELVDRCLATVANLAVLDRRLKEQDEAGQRLLALIGHSGQPRWRVGNLIEMLVALGHSDGAAPVLRLLEAGLLYPDLASSKTSAVNGRRESARLKSFPHWLGQGNADALKVFAHPAVSARMVGKDLGLPSCPGAVRLNQPAVHEADGLEWPLRLAALWQQASAAPFRRTQQGDFFKRDLDRLRTDPLLNGTPPDSFADLPDPALLAVALALREGVLREDDGELRAGAFPVAWEDGMQTTLAGLWSGLLHLEGWNAEKGWNVAPTPGNPQPSAQLLALLLLSKLPAGSWARPLAVEQWVLDRHPFWAQKGQPSRDGDTRSKSSSAGLTTFLLGLAFHLRLLQAAKDEQGEWVIRLSPFGRWLLGLGEAPAAPAAYPQTLLVQPNLEILAYRQGLTPGLIARLSWFAAWKTLGTACTLQLQPETVYRALEKGETFGTLLQTLERHGMKPTPAPVVDSLRTWAQKRERISVYPAASLFEFASAADLNEALARGLPAVRLSDRLAAVADEATIDYRHFRLAGTRDYSLPPEKCVEVEADGVTLSIDLARSDLLLETEVQRFAEPSPRPGSDGRRWYRMTPETLSEGRRNGLTVSALEAWFLQRVGEPLSPAARLLLTGSAVAPLELKRQFVLKVAETATADGLLQWPATRELLGGRLGSTALWVLDEHAAALQERLEELGISVNWEEEGVPGDTTSPAEAGAEPAS
jgi:hypothetical protein